MIPTKTYAPNPAIKLRVQGHQNILKELETAKLFRISDWMKKSHAGEGTFSTKNNRLGPSNGSRVLVTMLRMGMRATCAIINAGAIRAGKVYENQEWFAWSDLKGEIPFPTEYIALELPGRVLEATIKYSRRMVIEQDPPAASGGYLHACDQIEWNYETNSIDSIRGEKFDPDANYLTAMPGQFLLGIDNHVPLMDWAKTSEHLNSMDVHEAGRPAKLLLVEMFSALLWLEMGSFDSIDTSGDGILSRDEIRVRASQVFGEGVADLVVDSIMGVADLNQVGYITKLDMMVVQFVASDMLDHVATTEELGVMSSVAAACLGKRSSHADVRKVVEELKNTVNPTGNKSMNRGEAMKALGEVKRKSLLF
jgi:hypothetical protein